MTKQHTKKPPRYSTICSSCYIILLLCSYTAKYVVLVFYLWTVDLINIMNNPIIAIIRLQSNSITMKLVFEKILLLRVLPTRKYIWWYTRVKVVAVCIWKYLYQHIWRNRILLSSIRKMAFDVRYVLVYKDKLPWK